MEQKTSHINRFASLFGRFPVVLFLLILSSQLATGHSPSDSILPEKQYIDDNGVKYSRLWFTGSAHIAGFAGTLVALNQLWYKDFPRSSFHFYDDSRHWKQMDKMGHAITANQLSKLSYRSFRRAGLDDNAAAFWGSVSGSAFLTTIEILDGFSREWGASWSDIAANTLGSVSFYAQQKMWHEQKISAKYSFSRSGLEKYRPDLLGKNLPENMLKDYNGQTYWLSFNIGSLTAARLPVPPWLNIALGYGANNMLGSKSNPAFHNQVELPQLTPYRQFYLAPDIDYSRIPTRSPILHQVFTTLNFIKFPSPALEYNSQNGFVFHWVFF